MCSIKKKKKKKKKLEKNQKNGFYEIEKTHFEKNSHVIYLWEIAKICQNSVHSFILTGIIQ